MVKLFKVGNVFLTTVLGAGAIVGSFVGKKN